MVNEESVGSEVKKLALSLLVNLAVDASIAEKLYSDALVKVCICFVRETSFY